MTTNASKDSSASLPLVGPLTDQSIDQDSYPLRKLPVDYDVEKIRKRYLKLYTPLVSDAMEEFGLEGQALANGIHPLIYTMKVAGPAFTVHCISSPTKDKRIHNIRVALVKSMTTGCVQVRDTQGDASCGQFGEISATAALSQGCVGAVVDGSTRDSNYLIDMGFPTFCRFQNPLDSFGRFMTVDYQIPIYVQGVDGKLVLNPGDYVFGDNDGVVVVPKDLTVKVLEKAEERFASESRSRAAMAAGEDPLEVYRRFGRF